MQNRTASMPINIERPRSALLRGVHITEFKGHVINPDPIILQETDLLLEEFLSPTKLKALTGVNDLKSVEHLEMIVDTSETSLGNFGIYLPNLKQLKLNGSHVPRIRDLGTSLIHLRVLWLSRSGLGDLDGIPTLNNLQELYLAYNEISDLSSLSLLDNLKCLDMEGNLVEDIKQVEFLNLCTNLVNLTLYGNPICSKPYPNANENDPSYSYRHEVISILPSLQLLDDELTLNTKSLSPAKTSNLDKKFSSTNNSQQCPFDDDWQLINELIDEGIGPPEDKLAINESIRPGTSSSHGSRTSTSVRPLTAMRPLSSYRIKTSTQSRPKSRLMTSNSTGLATPASRQSSSHQLRPNSEPVSDASNLTMGPALQGNPLRALLSRKKNNQASNLSSDNDTDSIQEYSLNRPSTYKSAMRSLENYDKLNGTQDLKLENKELRDEIVKWRKEHTKHLEERKQYFEPQVLKIEDTEDQALSDVEVVDEDCNEYHNLKDLDVVNNDLNRKRSDRSSRPKSAFKQSFDYENEKEKVGLSENGAAKEEKRKRSKSKSKQKKKDEQDLLNSSLSSLSRLEGRDGSASRIKTDNNTSMRHKPIIVSSTSSSSVSQSSSATNPPHISNSSLANYIKPVATQSGLGTLKQLKTNLLPLSGIKLPK